jgi:hypothetical protein
MPTQRRAILITLLAVMLGLLLLDADGSPREMLAKVRHAVHDMRHPAEHDTLQG